MEQNKYGYLSLTGLLIILLLLLLVPESFLIKTMGLVQNTIFVIQIVGVIISIMGIKKDDKKVFAVLGLVLYIILFLNGIVALLTFGQLNLLKFLYL